MKTKLRQRELLRLLRSTRKPLTGAFLAETLGVCRQIIVQDIAFLKEAGQEIIATRYGYIMPKEQYIERVFYVRHDREQTADELSLIVACGGVVANVSVWHRVYGKLEADLDLSTPAQVQQFVESVSNGKSTELMSITDGYHYHTVRAETEAVLDEIGRALAEHGYLVPEE